VFAGAADTIIDPLGFQYAWAAASTSASVSASVDVARRICSTHIEDGYEHLDLIWANDAPEKIFKRVVRKLEQS